MDVQLDSTSDLSSFYDKVFNLNPIVIIIISVVVILYFVLFSSLGSNNESGASTNGSKHISIIILETILWTIFIILILLNGIYYIFGIDIVASIKNIFSNKAEVELKLNSKNIGSDDYLTNALLDNKLVNAVKDNVSNTKDAVERQLGNSKEVYHISDNKYTYKDAKAVCNAFNGRLANYKEIEESYKKGGDWCNYGWSEAQMALFPTQYDKWFKLQKIERHEHDCGRPGVNGGFIDNENVRFGVNCYGLKPNITPQEREKMSDTPLYPLTQKEINFNKRVEYWKDKLPDIMVAPFNNATWNM